VITGNVIQADERVFEFCLNTPELSLLHLFRRDHRHEQIRLVQFSGMKRHFPAENVHRSVVGIVMGVCTENLKPDIVVMKPAKNRA